MTKDEDFKLLKIQTCVLKVNIHCDGCRQKVKKLLQRIEGVFTVNIDAEQQKVTVSGSLDPATLIKKLVRAGKHAEIWSTKSNQNQKQQQQTNCIKDDKNGGKDQKQQQGLMKGLKAFTNQHKFPAFSSEDDEFDYDDDDDDDDEDDFEEELRLLQEKANHLGLLGPQQANMMANAKKNGAGDPSNGKMNNGANGQAGKKGGGGGNGGGNPNQNMGIMKGGMDQKNMAAAAAKMNNNTQLGGGYINAGEGKKVNDINAMLAGLHGHGHGNGAAGVGLGGNGHGAAGVGLGGNGHGAAGVGLGGSGLGFQAQMNNGFQGSSAGGYPTGGHHPLATMNNMQQQGYQFNHPSSGVNMNMQNRNNNMNMMMNEARYMQQQPQMMYNRSPTIPLSTGYYCNYYSSPYTYPPGPQPDNNDGAHSATAHMFSDENPNSCVVM